MTDFDLAKVTDLDFPRVTDPTYDWSPLKNVGF